MSLLPRCFAFLFALSPLLIGQITVSGGGDVSVGSIRNVAARAAASNSGPMSWSVNGVSGGNATVGKVFSTGPYSASYIAPLAVPSTASVQVRATSVKNSALFGETTMTVTPAPLRLWGMSPQAVAPGNFNLTLVGTGFTSGSVVMFGPTQLTTTVSSTFRLQASGTATSAQAGTRVPITVMNPNGSVSNALSLYITKPSSAITVIVSPSSATLTAAGTQQFTANVTGTSNTAVSWSVNGVAGGNATAGTISASGLYSAPSTVSTATQVTITATSAADSSRSGSARVTINPKTTAITVTVSPASATLMAGGTQQFAANVTGTSNSAVTWKVNNIQGGNASAGTISAAGLYTAPATISTAASITITAVSAADSSKSGSATITLQPKAAMITVTVSPATATLQAAATQQFSANVTGSSNTAVSWNVNSVQGGNATVGTISATGLYTAPATVSATTAITITAVSAADSSKSGSATITLQPKPVTVTVTVSPATATVVASATQQFSASVTGNSNTAVTWNVNGIQGGNATLGTISAAGLYTAPDSVSASTSVTITAVSAADSTKSGSATVTLQPKPAAVTVTVSPATATVLVSATQQFSANVTGSSNTSVTWTVNGIAGGDASVGTISSSGLYTAPGSVPAASSVTITATSAADSTKSGSATVTIQAKVLVTVTVAPASASVAVSQTQQFSATVSDGSSVTWSVNDVVGGDATNGTISAAGLYTAPASVRASATVTISAKTAANTSGQAMVTITAAAGMSTVTAGRFLEQATFGPTTASIAEVKQKGINRWLNDQIAMSETIIPTPADVQTMQQQYVNRLSTSPDQLRQRMIHALAQIIVISLNKNYGVDQMLPYLQILSKNALGNYRTLLGDITVSSQMGRYLDLGGSTKPYPGSSANENYPREVMQLFTIGTEQLNPDGTVMTDGNGTPLLNYGQTEVKQVALALTGWMYINFDWNNFTGPMFAYEQNHATTAKAFFNCTLPAGQNTTTDTNATLDCLFNHPSMAPFLATRLIRALVTSNPSAAYVQRVANVFADNGSGVRGDLAAVAKAILTDSEARNDTSTGNFGKLKDPIYFVTAFTRALNSSLTTQDSLSWYLYLAGQSPLSPPSVFSFYSPLYRIPKTDLFGPEFQIYGPTESIVRANLVWQLLVDPQSNATIDLSPFTAVAGNTQQLVNLIDQTFLYGRMPQAMRDSITKAINAQPDNTSKARTGIFLTASSSLYESQF